ncbi:DUF6410 domain-containing protein [Streptomyces sp. NPDC001889]
MANDTRAVDGVRPGSAGRFTVGRDMLPGGLLIRLLHAAVAVWYRVSRDLEFSAGYFLRTVLWLAVVAACYTVVYRLLGGALERLSPWVGSALLLSPTLMYPMGLGPDAFHDGMGLYMLLGFVLAPLTRYGGAEVAVLPALLTGRRHRLFSPFNVLDLAEAGLRSVPDGPRRPGWVLSAGVAAVYAVVLWVVPLLAFVGPVERSVGAFEVPAVWAVAALVPAGYLALCARRLRGAQRDKHEHGDGDGEWRTPAWAALALVVAVPVGTQVPDILWGLIILGGIAAAAVRGVRRLRGRRPAGPATD